ncbi:MAG: PaaI family thioesterase [Dehalococcoidia bacterium]
MKIDRARLEYLKKDAVQGFTRYLGLVPVSLKPGDFVTRIKLQKRHFQQDGFAHAGLIATMADHTAGYASYSLVPESRRILTIEYKINYFQPAEGEYLECHGHVTKPGKNILFTEAEVYSIKGKDRKLVARAMHTMASVPATRVSRSSSTPAASND